MSAERVGPLLPRADAGLAEEVALLGRFFGDWMVFADVPDHTRLRAPMTRTFSARNIAALEPFITERAERLIEDALEMGEFDLKEDMAMPLPLAVIGHVLGVRPADLPDFKQWSMELMAVPAMSGEPAARTRTAAAAVRDMEALFTELIAERRSRPTDDLLSVLVNTGADGRPLTDEEPVSTCALILAAGHETTANVMGNGMIALLTHPDQLAALRADRRRPLRHQAPRRTPPDLRARPARVPGRCAGPAGGRDLHGAARPADARPAPARRRVRVDRGHRAARCGPPAGRRSLSTSGRGNPARAGAARCVGGRPDTGT